jgi:hypothetical protein
MMTAPWCAHTALKPSSLSKGGIGIGAHDADRHRVDELMADPFEVERHVDVPCCPQHGRALAEDRDARARALRGEGGDSMAESEEGLQRATPSEQEP